MHYFEAIKHRADELNLQGRQYLDRLPFMHNEAVCERLWEIAQAIDAAPGENPDWVDSAMDGWIPFSTLPRNGSLYFALGYAMVAQDARLRNLLEVAEGRETEELDLATLAEQEIVDRYSDPNYTVAEAL